MLIITFFTLRYNIENSKLHSQKLLIFFLQNLPKPFLPMAHDSSKFSTDEVKFNIMTSPKKATLNFIRQFARTCACVNTGALGSMILN